MCSVRNQCRVLVEEPRIRINCVRIFHHQISWFRILPSLESLDPVGNILMPDILHWNILVVLFGQSYLCIFWGYLDSVNSTFLVVLLTSMRKIYRNVYFCSTPNSCQLFEQLNQRWGPYLQSCQWGFNMGKLKLSQISCIPSGTLWE